MATMKSILTKFRTELKTTFQAQKNIMDVTDKYLKQLEDAEAGGGSGGIDYSTDEQDTGIKWIDGSKIYQKTINFGALPNTTTKSVSHGISNLSYVCVINATAYNSTSGVRIPIPYPHGSGNTSKTTQLYVASDKIYIITDEDLSTYSDCKITLQYTKSV